MSVLSRRPADEAMRRRSRDALESATLALIGSGRAFAELSISEIATAARLSRPTFYAHFADKRALVLALGARLETATRAAAGPWLLMETDDLEGTLQAVLTAFGEHRAALDAVVEAATYDETVAAFWRDFHEWFLVNAAERARRADPALAAADAEARAYTLVWMTERCLSEHLVAPRVDERALLAAIARQWRLTLA